MQAPNTWAISVYGEDPSQEVALGKIGIWNFKNIRIEFRTHHLEAISYIQDWAPIPLQIDQLHFAILLGSFRDEKRELS